MYLPPATAGQGYCHTKNDYRLFRLSRITELQVLPETFSLRNYQKPILNFEETLETLQSDIKIRVHRSVLDRVLEFCTYDRVTPDGDDYYLVDYPFIERDYYFDMLLSFGDKCECIEPPHGREEIKRRIHSMAALYEHPRAQSITTAPDSASFIPGILFISLRFPPIPVSFRALSRFDA